MLGRIHVIAWTAFTALLALLLPLSLVLGCVSGAFIGLATLRHGAREGLYVLLGALAGTGAVIWVLSGSPVPALVLAATLWVPAWLMAAGLRMTASPGWVLAVAGGCASGLVLMFRVVIEDPTRWWLVRWETWLTPPANGAAGSREGGAVQGPGDVVPELLQFLEGIAPYMTGIVASAFLLVVLLTLFLARWGHALLDNPGGFGEEFRALALPRWFAHATGVVAIVLMVSSGGVKEAAAEIAMLMLLLLMVHGLAIVHGIVKLLEAARGWLVLLYLVLLVTPLSSFLVLALAMAGLSDSWVGYRQRVHNRIT